MGMLVQMQGDNIISAPHNRHIFENTGKLIIGIWLSIWETWSKIGAFTSGSSAKTRSAEGPAE
jgi:hypothetical protein